MYSVDTAARTLKLDTVTSSYILDMHASFVFWTHFIWYPNCRYNTTGQNIMIFVSTVVITVGGGGGVGPILLPGCWVVTVTYQGCPTPPPPPPRLHSTYLQKAGGWWWLVPPPDRGWSWVKVGTPSSQHGRRNPPRECDGVAAGILNFDIDEYAIFIE